MADSIPKTAYGELQAWFDAGIPDLLYQAIVSGTLQDRYFYRSDEAIYKMHGVYSDSLSDTHNALEINQDFWTRFMSSDLVAFAEDEGGYMMIYRLSDGAIYVYQTDYHDTQPLKKLADSADEFLERLTDQAPEW